MDPLILSLRFVHVVFGALWVGMMAFTVFVLTPAFREVGPDGAKVAAALQRRRLMTVLPIMALLTLASGFWLVERLYGGMARLMASRMGMAITIGAAAALVAFLVGIVVMRP